MLQRTDDLRIEALKELVSPSKVHEAHPANETAIETVTNARKTIRKIIKGEDKRLLVVVGPCSIHDPAAALEYSEKLKHITKHYAKELFLVMRVYFEKPRTNIGWKGLINDPHLDDSFDINCGLATARKVLLDLAKNAIPTATEYLDSISPQYISDLVCWGAIGARTTESQIHRELASGLSMPMGFKNGTDGNIQIAIDAVHAAANPHHFLGVTKDGSAAIVSTSGNDACHTILRGANTGPNYDEISINKTIIQLQDKKQNPHLMIDCSHGNSCKDHNKQKEVAIEVARQIESGNQFITGVMIESHLQEGKQALEKGKELTYGQSITDACISWEQTLPILDNLAKAIQARKNG